MNVLTCDFETSYSKDYSLSEMSTWDYITDPRFEVIGVSVKVNGAPAQAFSGTAGEVHRFLMQYDWNNSALCAHNAAFDGAILAWHLGIYPKAIIDTWSMCCALHGTQMSISLASMAEYYGVGTKGTEREKALGKRRADFTPEQMNDYMAYCCQDSDLTYALFQAIMARGYPLAELRLINWTIRCYTSGKLHLNSNLIEEALADVRARHAEAWASVNISDPGLLRKDEVLASMLQQFGVDPPKKITPKGNDKYAFAKSDVQFLELREHEDPRVVALVDARLEAKSSIEETRLVSLGRIAERCGELPFPMTYFGASTGRWSAWDDINCVTAGHEVLTPAGWVDISLWSGQPIMQWHADGLMTFDTQAVVVTKPYKGELICADSRFIRGEFTPEHRFVCQRGGKAIDYTAERVACLSGLDGMVTSGIYTDGTSSLTPEQARFIAAVCADGSLTSTRRLSFGFKQKRKIERIQILAEACDLKLREVPGDTTHFYLNNAPDWIVKHYGQWLLDLPHATAVALLDELQHWDGHVHDKSGATMLYTISKEQAQWLATLGGIHNHPATIYEYEANTSTGFTYHVHFGSSKETSLDAKHISKKPHDGLVYCPSVSSSYFLVRFNGAIHVTGNCQNLPKKGRIRETIVAPRGKVIIGADLSQIELRILSWVAGQTDILNELRDGIDTYSIMASSIYGYEVNKRDHPTQRFVGKSTVLGCGFGCSHAKLGATIIADAKKYGIVLDDISEDFFKRVVATYRNKNRMVVRFWEECDKAIWGMLSNSSGYIGRFEYRGNQIMLPRGIPLTFGSLRREILPRTGKLETVYTRRNPTKRKSADVKLWKGLLTENIVQALARDAFGNSALQCIDNGYEPVGAVHDELLFVVDEHDVDNAMSVIKECMITPPAWLDNCPLDCEIAHGESYAAVK